MENIVGIGNQSNSVELDSFNGTSDNIVNHVSQENMVNGDLNIPVERRHPKKNYKKKILLGILKKILVIAILVFAVIFLKNRFFSSPYDLYDQKNINKVYTSNKTVEVDNVKVVKIPSQVYEVEGDEWFDYLVGEKKKVMLIYWDGCPYARTFSNAINKEIKNFSTKYEGEIIKVPQMIYVQCSNIYCTKDKKSCVGFCPKSRLMDLCGEGVCIVNPVAKEVIVDNSQNSKQISVLLEAYSNWGGESLF